MVVSDGGECSGRVMWQAGRQWYVCVHVYMCVHVCMCVSKKRKGERLIFGSCCCEKHLIEILKGVLGSFLYDIPYKIQKPLFLTFKMMLQEFGVR